ncbi:hypothetical protein BH11MYX2_BH11MYX2_29080 [soil metagenome]
MKKILVVVAVVGMSLAACGKKKDPEMAKGDMGSGSAMMGSGSDMMPAGDGAGSGSAEAPAPGM